MKNRPWIIPAIALLVGVTVLLLWFGTPNRTVTFDIPNGSSARDVATILKKNGLIYSETLFFALAKMSGESRSLKSGVYRVSARTGMIGLLGMIAEGKVNQKRATIPEGFTSIQIADLLESEGIVDRDKFLRLVREQKLEGYLFPQTYFFEPKTPEQKVIDTMVREFNRNYTDDMRRRAREIKMTDRQVVTLGSIIEREAYLPEERPKISAVFHNRLRKHWYLESCATVLYALGKHKENLLEKDLKVNSPYNTYRHYGLPPGPISNPGVSSMMAALYPEQTSAMYFVVSSSGAHVFTRYLNEHVAYKKAEQRARKKNLHR